MSSIQTGIELNDGFTNVIYGIINAVNLAVSSMEDMQRTMNADIGTSAIAGVRDEINQATIAMDELNSAMQRTNGTDVNVSVKPDAPSEPVEIPIKWQADNLEVFTGTGIERFQQEIQSTNSMLETLNQTQSQIVQTAENMDILPDEAIRDMNNVSQRLQEIQQKILAIERNPLNIGTDTANAELEQLRAQLNQAVEEQNELNRAMKGMDISGVNEAYLQLSSTISRTERYIRDNTDEQGRFNQTIKEGADLAGDLKNTIFGMVSVYSVIAGVKKAFGFVQDCTEAFDTQLNAENQLLVVLGNMLDKDYVSQFELEVTADMTAASRALQAEFDAITEKASEIQSKGIYGDEAMIAGAAEFATYFSDPEAITTMMDTLADYAMGMSGGGEIDSTEMVNYATNLGKIMTGSYDAMTKKGFEFSDAQKAIIEGTATQEQLVSVLGSGYASMSEEMQKAAAISQVIEESWGGLYETMSNTPEGKIIQLNNAWGDLKETIGEQLYPYVILFVDAITENWSTIESVVSGITTGLKYMLGVLSWLLEAALNFAQIVVDNWSWISPIIYGAAAALAVYYGWQVAIKTIEKISKVFHLAHAAALMMQAAVTGTLTKETAALIAAQCGLNAAMYACPLVWIIVLIIALIVIICAVIAAINHFAGTSVSAMGVICGAFMTAAAFIGNLFVSLINMIIDHFVNLWNFIAIFANFLANVFTDPLGAAARLFFDFIDLALAGLESLASVIDMLFKTNLADAVAGWRTDLDSWVTDKFGEGKVVMEEKNAQDYHLEGFDYGEAWDAGYSFGESISDWNLDSLFDTTDIISPEDYINSFTGNVGDDVSDIAENTGVISDGLDCTEEDLKYLRDIAEQEAVNRFTTAEVTINQTNNNNVSSGMDLDGVISGLDEAMGEAVDIVTEGVHA